MRHVSIRTLGAAWRTVGDRHHAGLSGFISSLLTFSYYDSLSLSPFLCRSLAPIQSYTHARAHTWFSFCNMVFELAFFFIFKLYLIRAVTPLCVKVFLIPSTYLCPHFTVQTPQFAGRCDVCLRARVCVLSVNVLLTAMQ